MKNKIELFIPGRVEILGNHTDHQNGKVICSPISIGNSVIAERNASDFTMIESKNYGTIKINNKTFDIVNDTMPENSKKMAIGILKELQKENYIVTGTHIKIISNLPSGIGLGSSASFCLSIICSLNILYNFNIEKIELAKICQRVENNYLNKQSGLMDQIACLSNSLIKIDFKNPNNPKITKINFDFNKYGYNIFIINTESRHDDLKEEYSSIKNEMQEVAQYFYKNSLREVSKKELLKNINDIRNKISDRAWLRSYHYINENDRVDIFEKETKKKNPDIKKILNLINDSGNSSQFFLQNYYSTKNNDKSLVITDAFVKEKLKKDYAIKVCGGGFGGSCLLITNKKINLKTSYFNNKIVLFQLNLYLY